MNNCLRGELILIEYSFVKKMSLFDLLKLPLALKIPIAAKKTSVHREHLTNLPKHYILTLTIGNVWKGIYQGIFKNPEHVFAFPRRQICTNLLLKEMKTLRS